MVNAVYVHANAYGFCVMFKATRLWLDSSAFYGVQSTIAFTNVNLHSLRVLCILLYRKLKRIEGGILEGKATILYLPKVGSTTCGLGG
jgi:hypothetical protein